MTDDVVDPDDDVETTRAARRRGAGEVSDPAPPDDASDSIDADTDDTSIASRGRRDADDTLRVRSAVTRPASGALRTIGAPSAEPREASSPEPGRTSGAYLVRSVPTGPERGADRGAPAPQPVVDGAAVERAVRGRARRRVLLLGGLIVAFVAVAVVLLVVLVALPR